MCHADGCGWLFEPDLWEGGDGDEVQLNHHTSGRGGRGLLLVSGKYQHVDEAFGHEQVAAPQLHVRSTCVDDGCTPGCEHGRPTCMQLI